MPPTRKRGLVLTLDRQGKKKRKTIGVLQSDTKIEIDKDHSFELPQPLHHSTPTKCDRKNSNERTELAISNLLAIEEMDEKTNESRLEVEDTSHEICSNSFMCESCNSVIRRPEESNDFKQVYGILCFLCGHVNGISDRKTFTSISSCHSVLVAHELCDKCGKYGQNHQTDDTPHSHSLIQNGHICEKCGFGASQINTSTLVHVVGNKTHSSVTTDEKSLHTEDKQNEHEQKSMNLSSDNYQEDTNINNKPSEEIEKLLKQSLDIIKDNESGNVVMELLVSLSNGWLKPDCLTYAIFFDTLRAINSASMTEMRYSFVSKLYWKTFINKFGAAPLRFLSGWKHAGSLLVGRNMRGMFAGSEADIILSIPNEKVLKAFDPYDGEWPRAIRPGICEQVVEKIASANETTSVCIAFDGKKVSPGLKGDQGDINLLGREGEIGSVPPAQQKEQYIDEVEDAKTNIQLLSLESHSVDQLQAILLRMRNLLTKLTMKKALTREILEKKMYALEKFKSLASEERSGSPSKYQYVISLITANIVELKEIETTGDNLREKIARFCAILMKADDVWPTVPAVNISECWRYHSLHDVDLFLQSGVPPLEQFSHEIINMGLPFVKQRSSVWFNTRRQVRVTASTLYNAIGCAGLKAQKEHYQQVVLGFDRLPTTAAVQEAMDWGTKHEVCALATIATKVIPALYPEYCLLEVGAYRVTVGGVDIVISPDGMLHNNVKQDDEAAVEIKCPKNSRVPNSIPPRYYLQVQAHLRSKPGLQWCLFCVWTETTTKVFRVEKDNEVWSLVEQELNTVYGGANTRCPSRLSPHAKEINKMIRENIPNTCTVIAEVSSVHSCLFEDSPHVTVDEANQDPYTTCVNHDVSTVCIDTEIILSSLKFQDTMEEVICYMKQHYQLSRKKATEVIAFVASNTDRVWSSDVSYGAPICYFLKGYSLPSSVVRNILEDVLNYCYNRGIHCPVQSFDGQYVSLLQVSKDGKPQTVLQLQRMFWKDVCSMTKSQLLADMKTANCVTELQTAITFQEISGYHTIVVQNKTNIELPQTAVRYLKKSKLPQNALEDQESNQNVVQEIIQDLPESVLTAENETLTNMEGLQMSLDNPTEVTNTAVEGSENLNINSSSTSDHVEEDDILIGNEEMSEQAESESSHSTCTGNSPDSNDIMNILLLLKDQTEKWNDKNVDDLKSYLLDCNSLCKLTVVELKVLLKYFRDRKGLQVVVSGRKEDLIVQLRDILQLTGEICIKGSARTCSPAKLSHLCLLVMNSKTYPKLALCISYANWKFPSRVENWRNDSKINHGMVIPNVNENKPINWFYIPEYSQERGELLVRKIDPHHLLTRHRAALCKRDIGAAKHKQFIEVAKENTTPLKVGMMQDHLDMQSTDFAMITFSLDVETQLKKKGYTTSAEMCQIIREWFQSMDEPGIAALERCRRKMRYRDVLLSMVDLYKFPPPGMYVQGYPKVLWESTVASIDADIILYGLVKRRTYNQRAVSSQLCESLFSSMATMSGVKNGVPTCCDLETNFAKICGEMVVRYDPNRGFPVRLSSSTIYPEQQMELENNEMYQPMPPPQFISNIEINDHPFDSPHRRRTCRRKPKGISGLHEPARGVSGVRTFHRVNEGRLSALTRLGKSSTMTITEV